MDIYFVDVSMWAKGSKVISVSPRSLYDHQEEQAQSVGDPFNIVQDVRNSSTQESTALSYL